jgi:quercetin dioxygenase-like cupin family protein
MYLTSLPSLFDEPVSHNPEIRKRVMLRAGVLPPVTQLAEARFLPGQVAPAHAHADMAEVFLVTGGSGTITVDGRPHSLAAGTCVAVEPGEIHEIAATGTEPLVLVYFGVRTSDGT